MPPTDHGWTGFLRLPGTRWRIVLTAATEDEAWTLLHERAAAHPISDVCVMRAGENPYQPLKRAAKP